MLLLACGWLCVALGIIGYIVPLMPGTVFILTAAYCFSRSSERFHSWLVEHRILGRYIHAYAHGMKMPVRAKIITWLLVLVTVGISLYVVFR